MKFVLLIYTRFLTRFDAIHAEITESGELVDAATLADPVRAKTVLVAGDVRVTDGPFTSAAEPLAGYVVVDCDGERRATEIAARFPDCAVEVRPLMDTSGLEM